MVKIKIKKIILKLILLIINFFVLLFLFEKNNYFVYAIQNNFNFSKNKINYYKNLCSNNYVNNVNICENFKNWLSNEIIEEKKSLDDYRQKINENKIEISNQNNYLNILNQEIFFSNKEIEKLENQIKIQNNHIEKIEKNIEKNIFIINELEKKVKNILSSIQINLRTNIFIEFIMESKNFLDMIRKIEIFNAIKLYNQNLINSLNEEKKKLNILFKDLIIKKQSIELSYNLLKNQKFIIEEKKKTVILLISSIKNQNKNLEEYINRVEDRTIISESFLKSISYKKNITSKIFSRPIAESFIMTEGVWSYKSGGLHFGIDLSAPLGSKILSLGKGVIISTNNGCPTYGNLYNKCNGGWGNYITYIISFKNKIYGVLIAHLMNNSITVKPKSFVEEGQVLGLVGSSGSSTGPHLHLEMYYLGNDSIENALKRWDGTTTFGTGSSNISSLEKRCFVNKNNPPCRVDPASILGYSINNRY